jgi:hypothetical protein
MSRITSAVATLILMGSISLTGCYHATIHTGLEPSNRTVGNKWASGWIYGLVPPKALDAGEECGSGVARVDTQQSFTNGLVGFLTLGIYTPMEVVATCATSGGDEDDLQLVVGQEEPEKALKSGEPFYLKL